MREWELAEALIRDNLLAARALAALQLRQLDDRVRALVNEAIGGGTGRIELRERIETAETGLVLVPTDGTEALWFARTA